MTTTNMTKATLNDRLRLLRSTEQIILKSLLACKGEIAMLEGSLSPQLPVISSPYAEYKYHKHTRNQAEV